MLGNNLPADCIITVYNVVANAKASNWSLFVFEQAETSEKSVSEKNLCSGASSSTVSTIYKLCEIICWIV